MKNGKLLRAPFLAVMAVAVGLSVFSVSRGNVNYNELRVIEFFVLPHLASAAEIGIVEWL